MVTLTPRGALRNPVSTMWRRLEGQEKISHQECIHTMRSKPRNLRCWPPNRPPPCLLLCLTPTSPLFRGYLPRLLLMSPIPQTTLG